MAPILRCENVSKYFGDFAAVKDLSFHVNPGEVFGIAGPNGAGKTTLFNVISNIPFPPSSGKIIFNGEEIQGLKPHKICHLGLARTFQIPLIFKEMTYLENVLVGGIFGKDFSFYRSDSKLSMDSANQAIKLVGLFEKRDNYPKSAPLFDIKRLMIASAVAMKPKLLLLDEPVGGLNSSEIMQLVDLIRKLQNEGITIVIIEHVMTCLMTISQRVMILNYGEKLAEGKPEEVAENEAVIEAYLGKEYRKYLRTD
jgi:branched-chain amino acid transport system ATP-binding protein